MLSYRFCLKMIQICFTIKAFNVFFKQIGTTFKLKLYIYIYVWIKKMQKPYFINSKKPY
ncbi:hypothetical protein BVAVS116_D0010 (plasmid) [Borreliella valaisiana VS116]|uniref:Uncharacterized protein n=1 Tax=Borreliella valaisiana VS116 TaxID=445987 RepID=C0R8W5_BORVA|nr:hypothetical protein BVAVS116_D0010 [Borreliella valaisiana VS116]